jgi:prepilin-type N-terminal cleavage/methylation domain-containing protein
MARSTAGYSLVELLVSLLIAGVMMTATTGFFSMNVATRHNMGVQTEAQQGLRALLEMVTQELRQAGACLPTQGPFVALGGIDDTTRDSLTVRIGQVNRTTLTCVRGALSVAAAAGAATLQLNPGEGSLFSDDSMVYITDGGVGEFYPVAGATANTLTLEGGLTRNYVASSGVYGVDERIYEVDASDDPPVLTVAIDGGDPQPLVNGVEAFDVQYLLGPCDPDCESTVSLPSNDAEWRLVRELAIDATVRAHEENKDGVFPQESGQITVKPRNLI